MWGSSCDRMASDDASDTFRPKGVIPTVGAEQALPAGGMACPLPEIGRLSDHLSQLVDLRTGPLLGVVAEKEARRRLGLGS